VSIDIRDQRRQRVGDGLQLRRAAPGLLAAGLHLPPGAHLIGDLEGEEQHSIHRPPGSAARLPDDVPVLLLQLPLGIGDGNEHFMAKPRLSSAVDAVEHLHQLG
jgi:hypothetical protein